MMAPFLPAVPFPGPILCHSRFSVKKVTVRSLNEIAVPVLAVSHLTIAAGCFISGTHIFYFFCLSTFSFLLYTLASAAEQ
jgi:hypothetical protein